jgi:hypothetical protein
MVRENNMTDLLSTRIPHRNAKRESLVQLRRFHLDGIRSMAMGPSTISELQECLTKNIGSLAHFGSLRSAGIRKPQHKRK